VIALAAPWFFFGVITIGLAVSLWDSPGATRTQATQITRALLYVSMILLPVAASVYGGMASRRRILKGVLGCVVGVVLWLANLLCFGYVVEHEVDATRRSVDSRRSDWISCCVPSGCHNCTEKAIGRKVDQSGESA
jgi:hypothetical protein